MNHNVSFHLANVVMQRTYGSRNPAPWLLTVLFDFISSRRAEPCTAYPQARAVVDDFGSLVIVTGWH